MNANISEIKLKLLSILQNLEDLEQLNSQNSNNITISAELQEKIVQTDAHLNILESIDPEKLAKTIKRRQHKRNKQKKAQKLNKQEKTRPKPTTQQVQTAVYAKPSVSTATPSNICPLEAADKKANATKPHHYLRNSHNAQRFLRTFELLKILHLERGQDGVASTEFGQKLQHLTTIWNNIYHENQAERTQQQCLEDKWTDVLFGASVKTYYHKTQMNMQELLNIRRTWDSYLTRSSMHGNSIPLGWVVPKANALPSWQKYLQDNS